MAENASPEMEIMPWLLPNRMICLVVLMGKVVDFEESNSCPDVGHGHFVRQSKIVPSNTGSSFIQLGIQACRSGSRRRFFSAEVRTAIRSGMMWESTPPS
jgi:hypothetical protein